MNGGGPELRIALFTGNYNYIEDGVALTLNRLVDYLERQGIAVLVFAPTGPRPALAHKGELVSVPSIPIPFRSEYRISLGLPAAARRRLKAFRPTLFHIAVPDILGYRALKLAKDWKVPVVASYHTRYDTYLKHYGLSRLEGLGLRYLRSFYKQCRQVYPPSESMAAIIRAEGLARDVRVWSRGVDSGRFSPARRNLTWRRARGLGDHEVAVSFVGRLVKEKNTEQLIRIFDRLASDGVAFRPMIVGDGPEMARMRSALPGAIFTGFLHGDALAEAYASSDIFLFPSESETFGNVTLEAMASGLPAICADASGSRSLVVDGETGFLIDPRRDADYVARAAELTGDPDLRSAMGQRARAQALSYSWDAIMAGLVANYREALAQV